MSGNRKKAAEVGEHHQRPGGHGEDEVAPTEVGRRDQRVRRPCARGGRSTSQRHHGHGRRATRRPSSSPSSGPRLRASMTPVTAPERLQLPAPVHPPRPAGRGRPPGAVDGVAAVGREHQGHHAHEATRRPSWTQNRVRHPKYSMIGAPRVIPMTGPPAPTIDHHPMAFTRSSGANSRRMSAIEAVPVAAPWIPSSDPGEDSRPTPGARAVADRGHHGAAQPQQVQPPVAEQVAGLAEEGGGQPEGQQAGRWTPR